MCKNYFENYFKKVFMDVVYYSFYYKFDNVVLSPCTLLFFAHYCLTKIRQVTYSWY